jgi:glutaredoxin-related protein
MEDDPGLTAPQLWVNRTLLHGLDAIKCPSFSNSTHDTINKTEIANAYKISQL